MNRRRAVAILALIPTFGSLAARTSPADEPKTAAERPRSVDSKPADPSTEDVENPPPISDFLIIPLRVHLLSAPGLDDLDCKLEEADITRILGKVNRVWSVAGIHFALESCRREPAARLDRFAEIRERGAAIPLNAYALLAPDESRATEGQNVYYIQSFSVNGVFLGNRTSFVQATAKLRPVEGGIDEPLPRVTAHELGHALGLPHRQNRTNLLASGTTGTRLNRAEVEKARANAARMRGVMTHARLVEEIAAAEARGDAAVVNELKKRLEAVRASAAHKTSSGS
ncbi:MAG: Matrixin [Isosphaeraceae bacterium]|nr:Matrixin [Isosphaeraceae bacterium]